MAHLLDSVGMAAAPPAKNATLCFKMNAEGKVEHAAAADEASCTEHEQYIICAAMTVRARLV